MSQEEDDLTVQFEQLIHQLSAMKSQIAFMHQNVKMIEKSVKRKLKGVKKENAAAKATKAVRAPSGFAKPSKVTNELCAFMNKSEGTEIARTDVTRALVSYIKENKLENTTNSKMISPDDKLKVLLGIEDGQELNYFNIQKYMNKHFVKANSASTA